MDLSPEQQPGSQHQRINLQGLDLKKINFANLNLAVFGDVMLDQYLMGTASRISPEAPVPVVKVNTNEHRAGGAANVAINLSTLGCQVKLLGLIGKDQPGEVLINLLQNNKIQTKFITLDNYKTITKTRILSQHQQLLRLDEENSFCELGFKKLINDLGSLLNNCHALILSDYAKGTIHAPNELINLAKKFNLPVIVDPKGNDFSVYANATVITPNTLELDNIIGHNLTQKEILAKSKALIKKYNIKYLILTQGEQGLTVIPNSNNEKTLHIPAEASEVYDVTGAGDTVVAYLAAGLARGMSIYQSAKLAVIAASLVVSKIGTAAISWPQLLASISYSDLNLGIVNDRNKLAATIKLCQAKGEVIVFANGCYDIIHYGHINFLEQAKAFGDRLVVGINTDDSVRRLKGSTRPIHTLQERMQVLSGLKAVDWVIPFNENTPGELITSLNPNVLVKTNEKFKTIADIPIGEGVEHVLANNGLVKIIAIDKSHSSSNIINKLNECNIS